MARTVVGFAGTTVLLSDEHGSLITPDLAVVCTRGVFEPARDRAGDGLASGLLPDVAEPAVAQARWWERHVLEVITGRGPQTAAARAEYDPQTRTVADREAAKAAELSGPFGVFSPVRPGEPVQIDSTPLDIAVMLDDGVIGRVELTGMIDVATRTVTAAVLRPTTKSVDASLLLARTVTPEPMRPGWADALRSQCGIPHRWRPLVTAQATARHTASRSPAKLLIQNRYIGSSSGSSGYGARS